MPTDPLVQAIVTQWTQLPHLAGDRWPALEPRLSRLLAEYAAAVDAEARARAVIGIENLLSNMAPDLLDYLEGQTAQSKGVIYRGSELDNATIAQIRAIMAATAPSPPAMVARYTDIHAPARAQVEKRFPVIVGLTCRPFPESAAIQAFELRADLPVQVRLGPTSLEVLGERVQELPIRPEQDSEPVVFYFKGHQPGPAHIILDFLQGGNFLGQVPLTLEITPGPVDETTEHLPGQRLRLPSDVPPPGWILFIHYDRFEGQPSLFFTLDQAGVGSWPFPPLPLEADPTQTAARLYDGLTSLQARRARGDLSSQDVEDEVRQLGWNLWRDLIPPRLQDLYAEERAVWPTGSLLIVSDEPYFPWELVWPYDRAGTWQDEGHGALRCR